MPSQQPEQAQDREPLPEIRGYVVKRAIGRGGMSIVYLAEQEALGREVAVKVMLPEALADEVSRRRFENEVRTIARLEHPHIVGIFEVGRSKDGLPYYAMPYLARGHLGQCDFTQDEARVVSTLRALLSALGYAHARGVVHRDVKAENVLFDEANRPLLADFGIALRQGNSPRVTMAGLAVGSTAYMAPEQARGDTVDNRADLYSVGVLAYEMLMGRLPFIAGDALSMAMQHVQDPVPRLPRDKRHWQRFVDKAMSKSPAMRFRSAQQMLDALQRIERKRGSPGFALARRTGDGIERLRHLPVGAWIAVGLLTAALVGMGLRKFGYDETQAMPTAMTDAVVVTPALESAAEPAAAAPGTADPTSAMLRPPPESVAEPLMRAAEKQIGAGRLTTPKRDNAYDNLVAAHRADPGHARLPATVDALIDAFSAQIRQRLTEGDEGRALDYIEHAEKIVKDTQRGDSPALQRMRASVGRQLTAKVDDAAKSYDRPAAIAAAQLASKVLPAETAATLLGRAQRIPQAGDRVADGDGLLLVRNGDRLSAVGRNKVSRAEYARFATATRRPPALCRERASLLRIMSPRDWKSPGFAQTDIQPVVCVSWNDAQAYLRWLGGQHSGHRYRLPSVAETREYASTGNKPVAEWLTDCAEGCSKRNANGLSWRGTKGTRPLDPARGYDDVGFRVARDL